MKHFIIDLLAVVLPFLKKKTAREIREFSELIREQYEFLAGQLEKVMKDYLEISAKVREMHTEMFRLREELSLYRTGKNKEDEKDEEN